MVFCHRLNIALDLLIFIVFANVGHGRNHDFHCVSILFSARLMTNNQLMELPSDIFDSNTNIDTL